eukprot:6210468-Pleurochrysis_carterae.AAC.1
MGSELARAGDRYNRHRPRGHWPLTRFPDGPRPLGSTLVKSHMDNSEYYHLIYRLYIWRERRASGYQQTFKLI